MKSSCYPKSFSQLVNLPVCCFLGHFLICWPKISRKCFICGYQAHEVGLDHEQRQLLEQTWRWPDVRTFSWCICAAACSAGSKSSRRLPSGWGSWPSPGRRRWWSASTPSKSEIWMSLDLILGSHLLLLRALFLWNDSSSTALSEEWPISLSSFSID